MDAKITKTRLSRMLSYDWLKILFSAAALIVVWVLIFTMTATPITPSQKFTVMNYVGNTAFDDDFFEHYKKALSNGVFSYEVIEGNSEDLTGDESMVGSLLQARTAIEEGDVIFVANQADHRSLEVQETVDETTGEVVENYVYTYTYLQAFVSGWYYKIYDVKKYLEEMDAFLAQYYEGGDWKTPAALNEEKVKEDFNARTKKDKRFKKSAARRQGEKDEVERIKKYRDALVKFHWYLQEGVVALEETTIENFFGEGEDFTGTFSINLCPTEGMMVGDDFAMGELKNMVGCKPIVYEDGIPAYGDVTAENMNVCFFRFDGVADSFEYESLLYTVNVIDSYSKHGCPEEVYVA
ncbi:MAG: hypothetical protein IJV83_05450 [Clostridia bacterium]|nr:hypothetical protein [Clostridia bacterium]MBQ9714748.1 hypothetical protein [Clostridia bacterium]